MSNVFELPAHGDETARDLTPGEWAHLERNAAEILAAFGLLMALGHPLSFAWVALAEALVIAIALLPRRAPSRQEEIA